MRKMLLLSAMPCLMLCACKTVTVTTPPASCARLIPESWSEGVKGAPIPDLDALDMLGQVKAWAGAYVASEGQLTKANGRTADAIGIMQRCEAMVNESRADSR